MVTYYTGYGSIVAVCRLWLCPAGTGTTTGTGASARPATGRSAARTTATRTTVRAATWSTATRSTAGTRENLGTESLRVLARAEWGR